MASLRTFRGKVLALQQKGAVTMRIIQTLALACFLFVITGCAGSQKTSGTSDQSLLVA